MTPPLATASRVAPPPPATRAAARPRLERAVERAATPRRFVMCRPDHFAVTYAINPWMQPGMAVDRDLAIEHRDHLRALYVSLGHRVHEVPAVTGLPDMVFAANAGVAVGDRALAARFRHPERAGESTAYLAWFAANGYPDASIASRPMEGEGDFLVAGDLLLAGSGFRTDPASHMAAAEVARREVVPLELVDPRYYHLDTALAVLDAILASDADADAGVLGLNAVSDGRNVILPVGADGLAAAVAARGFTPLMIDLSELRKAGGGPKCCTLELHAEPGKVRA